MVERQFTEDRIAALYDLFHPPQARSDYAFYLKLVMSARSVLDVGCGTGSLLRRARELGYAGRLCGLDPASGMLNQARQRTDIEWVLGDLSQVDWHRAFDLIIMTGHAFQEFTEDDELRAALARIRSALTARGQFVFETRNPLVRAWENWSSAYSGEVVDANGVVVRRQHRLVLPVEQGVVRFTTTYMSSAWSEPVVSYGNLRFLSVEQLVGFLDDAGLVIERQLGDWDGQPLSGTSPEIISFARRRELVTGSSLTS